MNDKFRLIQYIRGYKIIFCKIYIDRLTYTMQNILWIILIFFIGVICGATILWVAIYKKYMIIDIDINNDMINKIHQYTQSPIIR